MSTSFWVRLGSLTMFLGVVIGAFGAHGLKNVLTEPMKAVYETGVHYQLVHGLALFVVAWLSSRAPNPLLNVAGWSFAAGILLFSGSLYLLSLSQVKAWGAVTPIGGLSFLIGWGCLFASGF